jgi:ATP-binding cassette subfamily C protein
MNLDQARWAADARMPAGAAALFARGARLSVGGDRAFLLSGEQAWLVVAGHLDVFAVRLRAGRPDGPRDHLLRAHAGQAVFGVAEGPAEEGFGLLAVGAGDTELLRVGRGELEGIPPNGGVTEVVGPWIDLLYAAIARDRPPSPSRALAPGGEIDACESETIRPAGDLVWLRHLDGRTRLMGRPELELEAEGFTPVSGRAWLEPVTSCRVAAADARGGLPSVAELWAGLERLHRLVLRDAALAASAEEQATAERLRQRSALRQAVLRDACQRLASTMAGSGGEGAAAPAAPTAVQDLADPLFAACRLVGRALDLTLQSCPQAPGASAPRDPLAAILRASRVRSRRVALRGAWWREDNGPLLAYLADGKRPIALLRPTAAGPYLARDPAAGTEWTVDAAAAERIEPFAHTFYRPFPARALRVRDLLGFGLHRGRRDVALVVGLAVGGALLGMVPSLATGVLFNTVIPGAQRSQLLEMTLVLLACAVTAALVSLANGIALLRLETRATAALQSATWDRLLALPVPFFRPFTSGELAVRAMSIESIRQAVSGATLSAFIGLVMAAGNFVLMYWYSPKLALWATVIIAGVLCFTVAGSYLQLRPQRDAVKLESKTSGLVLQLLTGVAKLRVAAAEVPAFALWVRSFSGQRRVQYRSRDVANWLAAFNAAVPVLANLAIFYLALPRITETRELATGDFLAFLAAFTSCSGSIVAASLAVLATINTIPLYEQARPILQALPEVDAGKADPGALTGDVEVQHAMFRYQADGPLVLRDVSFRVRPGEFVAFVGPSGSGKSTLLRLLLGFERLEAGGIYFDGQEIGDIDVQALRRQLGVVLQGGRLMSGDIFTNIVGSSAATLDEAWEAARMAGLADDVRAMPMGMHTVVSDGGGTLSGGQRQRLLIARALVNRPRILLFDEATSALDNRTQAMVSRSLESLQATRIVVAHRLTTIMSADRIFVVEKGRIVQTGSYAELMAQEGPFAELAKRQIA